MWLRYFTTCTFRRSCRQYGQEQTFEAQIVAGCENDLYGTPIMFDCSHTHYSNIPPVHETHGFCVEIGATRSVAGKNPTQKNSENLFETSISSMKWTFSLQFGDVTVHLFRIIEMKLDSPSQVRNRIALMDFLIIDVVALLWLDVLDMHCFCEDALFEQNGFTCAYHSSPEISVCQDFQVIISIQVSNSKIVIVNFYIHLQRNHRTYSRGQSLNLLMQRYSSNWPK